MQNNFNLNVNHLTSPMQQIMELNQKTFQKLSYIEPQELTQIHDPKALVEKNMGVFIDNSHTSIDYMYQLFNILENSWVNLSNDAREKTKDLIQNTQSAATSAMNKMSSLKSKTAHPQSASHSSRKRTISAASSHTSSTHASRDGAPRSTMRASSAKKDDTHKT